MKNGITHYYHGVSWEEENGVSQGYCVKDTLYISGQFSHDMQGSLSARAISNGKPNRRWTIWIGYWRDSAPNVRTWRMWRST